MITNTKNSVVVLGIDPGLADLGWGVIVKKSAHHVDLVDYGCLKTSPALRQAERLKKINQALIKIIKKYQPDQLAVEDIFFHKNVKTAIKVAEARGVIMLTGAQASLEVREFTPLQVKQALTGYGRADKKQMQQMVKITLGLKANPKPDDAADALAVAICCLQSAKLDILSR